jgi:hypothetical protein
MEVSCHPHAPTGLPAVESPQYPLDKNLGGLQIRSEWCGEHKNLCKITVFYLYVSEEHIASISTVEG